MLDTIGIQGILKLLDGENDRSCEFRSCLAFYDGREMKFFESKSPGIISTKVRRIENEKKWSDLWYIFIPENFNKTLAEFTDEDFIEYNNFREDSSIIKFGKWYNNSN